MSKRITRKSIPTPSAVVSNWDTPRAIVSNWNMPKATISRYDIPRAYVNHFGIPRAIVSNYGVPRATVNRFGLLKHRNLAAVSAWRPELPAVNSGISQLIVRFLSNS